jgi:hypothetical protein
MNGQGIAVDDLIKQGAQLQYNNPAQIKQALTAGPEIQQTPTQPGAISVEDLISQGASVQYNNPTDSQVRKVKEEVQEVVQDPALGATESITQYVEDKEESYLARLEKDFEESFERGQRAVTKGVEGDITTAEVGLRIAGSGANFILDAIGETVVEIGEGVSYIVPDFIEEPVKNAIADAGRFILETDAGKAGMYALSQGMEAWEDYSKKNPRAAENIRSVVDVTALVAPTPKGLKIPSPKTKTKLAQKAEKLRLEGIADAKVKTDQQLLGSFIDVTGKDVITRSRDGVVKMTQPEQNAVDVVKGLKGYKISNSAQKNINAVNKAIDNENAILQRLVSDESINIAPATIFDDMIPKMNKQLEGMIDIKNKFGPMADDISQVVEVALKKNGTSAKGVLQTRRDLDDWFKLQQRGGFDKEGPMRELVTIARNSLNDSIALVVPESSGSLKRLNGLYTAQSGLAPMANKDTSKLGKAFNRVLQVVGTNRDIGFALTALGTSYAMTGPAITGVVAMGTGAYFGGKVMAYGLSKATGKKTRAAVLKTFDKALKTGQLTAKQAQQLRADRALILQAINDLEEAWESGGAERATEDGYSPEEAMKPEEEIKADIEIKVPKQ